MVESSDRLEAVTGAPYFRFDDATIHDSTNQMTLLAFETSCDETSAAVVRGGEILSSVISSQIKLHAEYGGVVPELAVREHLRNLQPVTQAVLREAGVGASEIDA